MKSYIAAVIDCFTKMDLKGLHSLLKDDYSYEDTSKEVFLQQIEALFTDHRQAGDTGLLPFKGACAGSGCENCGKSGYRFIGNVSRNYVDMVFIEEGDDIKDIFTCSDFITGQDTEPLAAKDDFVIYEDDKLSFNRTPDYDIKLAAALTAMQEILPTEPRELEMEEVQYWLQRHRFTYEKIGSWDVFEPTLKWTPFAQLYGELQTLVEFLETHGPELETRYSNRPNETEEEEMLNWVLENETFFAAIPYELSLTDFLPSLSPISTRHHRITVSHPMVKALYSYYAFYDRNKNSLFEKYSIYTDQELNEVYSDEQYEKTPEPIFNLSYHLKRRKEMEELGVTLSYYLNRNKEEDLQ